MLGRLTAALFFLLLVWGNLVAGLKFGLVCPDWPLCQGQIIPPLDFDIWMEFTHRLIAAVATLFLAALAWQRFKAYDGPAKAVPLAAVALVATEIILGGLTVLLKLPTLIATAHFMTGLAVFLLVCYMAVFDDAAPRPRFAGQGYAGFFLWLGALIYMQASLGAYVRHSEAGLACPDFPTCQGQWLPHLDGTVLMNYSHRLMAYLIVISIASLALATCIDARLQQHRRSAATLFILGAIQIGAGAGVVQSSLNAAAVAIHLAVALAMLIVVGRMWVGES